MSKDLENLREAIRKILEQQNSLSEERVNGSEEDFMNSKQCTWELFEEFGLSLLLHIGYKGDYSVIKTVRKEFEGDGWDFEDI